MIPEIEEIRTPYGTNSVRLGYDAKCPRCAKRSGLEASPGAAIYVLANHMNGH